MTKEVENEVQGLLRRIDQSNIENDQVDVQNSEIKQKKIYQQHIAALKTVSSLTHSSENHGEPVLVLACEEIESKGIQYSTSFNTKPLPSANQASFIYHHTERVDEITIAGKNDSPKKNSNMMFPASSPLFGAGMDEGFQTFGDAILISSSGTSSAESFPVLNENSKANDGNSVTTKTTTTTIETDEKKNIPITEPIPFVFESSSPKCHNSAEIKNNTGENSIRNSEIHQPCRRCSHCGAFVDQSDSSAKKEIKSSCMVVRDDKENETSFKESVFKFFQSRFVCLGPRKGKKSSEKVIIKEIKPSDFIRKSQADGFDNGHHRRNSNGSLDDNSFHTPATGLRTPMVKGERSLNLSHGSMEESIEGYERPIGLTGYNTPQQESDTIAFTLEHFERTRHKFNQRHSAKNYRLIALEGNSKIEAIRSKLDSERIKEMRELAGILVNASQTCFTEDASTTCQLVHDTEGLRVWKKEFAMGRILLRAEFLVAVTPLQYCRFASDPQKRMLWDANVSKITKLENIGKNMEVSYIAIKRVATVFPRDTTNLKVVRKISGKGPDLDILGGEEQEHTAIYTSCSCTIEHPDRPETDACVRMDVRMSSYVAEPVHTPFGVWTKVSTFNEGDPRGWIPSAVVKMLASKMVPRSVEKLVASLMNHYSIDTDGLSSIGFAQRRLNSVDIH